MSFMCYLIVIVLIMCMIMLSDNKTLELYTSAEFSFYLALYASVGQEPKHIMVRWHFCNFSQVLGLGSPNT